MGTTRSVPETKATSGEAVPSSGPQAPARVWIHDPNDSQGSLRAALLGRGYHVTVFRSSEEWREARANARPDLMIIDLDDPSANEIFPRSIESDQMPKLIVVAGSGDIDRRLEAVRMGANAMFVRPIVTERLTLAVDRLTSPDAVLYDVLLVSSAGSRSEIRAINETAGIRLSVVPPRSLFSGLTAIVPECVIIDAQDLGIEPDELVRLVRSCEGYVQVPIAIIDRGDTQHGARLMVRVVGTFGQSFKLACEELPAIVAVLCEIARGGARQAHIDPLTGFHRDIGAEEHQRQIFDLAARFNVPVACLVARIDDYQRIAEERGADAAQMMVKNLAVIVRTVARETDLLIRSRTDEIVMYLLGVTAEEAQAKAGQMLNLFSAVPRQHGGDLFFATLSIGIAVRRDKSDAAAVLAEAREHLHHALKGRENRMEFHESD